MLTFTLDTNCIIDLAENRDDAAFVRELAEAHGNGRASVAVAAVSASERQQGDRYLENYDDFRGRLESLGLGNLVEIQGIAYMGISYWDHSLASNDEMTAREEIIHNILFSKIPFKWSEFATSAGLDVEDIKVNGSKKWRNAFCDRQMYWAHDHAKRDVFVTRDANFKRLNGHADFQNALIMSPRDAVGYINKAND